MAILLFVIFSFQLRVDGHCCTMKVRKHHRLPQRGGTLKLRNTDNWKNVEQTKHLLFFAQVIEELTFDYSLDSYKAPTTNAPYLIQEAMKQIEILQDAGLNQYTLNPILDEMEARLRGNPVVSSLINMPLDKYICYDRENYDDVFSRLSVLKRDINPNIYSVRCMELIFDSIKSGKRKDIVFLSRELVTTLVNLGVDSSHIYNMCAEYFYLGEAITEISQIKGFFRLIFPHHHKFKILFKIKSVAEILGKDEFESFNISIDDSVPEVFKLYSDITRFGKLEDGQKFVIVDKINAMDAVTAVSKAEDSISRLHDLFRIFHHKESYELSKEALVEQCCVDGIRKVSRTRNRMQFVNDHRPSKAGKKFEEMLRVLKLPHGPDRAKFFRLVDFHGMSVSAGILENQLLNIWISLETISPSNRRKTKIESVVDGISPFIGLNYFHRIFERLTFDLFRWNRWQTRATLSKLDLPKGLGPVERVAHLVVLEKNHHLLEEILPKMGNFELLRFRVNEIYNNFSDPKKASNYLDRHQKRVSWQIRRIYRTRNSIVHSGNTPEYTAMLVENAHDYFDQVFLTVCKLGSDDNAFLTLEECFNFAHWQFENYRKDLASIEEFTDENVPLLLWKRKAPPDRYSMI